MLSRCSILSLIITIAITACVYFNLPKAQSVIRGIYLPAQDHSRVPIDIQNVDVFSTPPHHFTLEGEIRLAYHQDPQSNEESVYTDLVSKARMMAAAHGANGVWITLMGQTRPTGNEAPLSSDLLFAKAIYLSTP